MAKAFVGKDFLADKKVDVELSNGFKCVVDEIHDDVFEEIKKLEDSEDIDALKKIVALYLKATPEDLVGVGFVELSGLQSFLIESLLGSK